jgi:hypothetical protein
MELGKQRSAYFREFDNNGAAIGWICSSHYKTILFKLVDKASDSGSVGANSRAKLAGTCAWLAEALHQNRCLLRSQVKFGEASIERRAQIPCDQEAEASYICRGSVRCRFFFDMAHDAYVTCLDSNCQDR